MEKKKDLKYKHKNFEIIIDEQNQLFIVDFKGRWEDKTFELYMEKLKHFTSQVDAQFYTLILNPIEFKIYIPELRALIADFLKVYSDSGFKHIRLVTLLPQKEFRRIIKSEGDKVNFITEFCDPQHIQYEV